MNERETKEAERLGGSDADMWSEYEKNDAVQYCNKPDHFARSVSHQSNHKKARRVKNLLKDIPEILS